MQQSSTIDIVLVVVFTLVIIGGLIAILRIAPKINQNLKKNGDDLYRLLTQQEGVVAVAPYFYLVPKMAPKMIGILVPEQNSLAIYLRKEKQFQRIAYSEIGGVKFPNDPLYGFITINKMDGHTQEVKFGQDLNLIQTGQGAGKAVTNLQLTNQRFKNILQEHRVKAV